MYVSSNEIYALGLCIQYFLLGMRPSLELKCTMTKVITLSAHVRGTAVTFLCVCLSQTGFEDGFILSLQTDIKAYQVNV